MCSKKRENQNEFGLWSGIRKQNLDGAEEILFTAFTRGSFYVKRKLFFHNESSTLILTDLIENIETEKLSAFGYCLNRRYHYPNGKLPKRFKGKVSYLVALRVITKNKKKWGA